MATVRLLVELEGRARSCFAQHLSDPRRDLRPIEGPFQHADEHH